MDYTVVLEVLHRLFLGPDFTYLALFEIIFRTGFMYMYTILNVRMMDKRSMGMLNPFEIIIIIAFGSAVGDPMFYKSVPLLPAMITISTIVFIERVISSISVKSSFFERFLNGIPVLIIRDGELLHDAMRYQNITQDEIYSILRMRGVLHLSDVERAYLEPSGSISIIKKDGIETSDTLPIRGMRGM
ncbi:MAG TPA: YetF domain-containing protein [Candidatus Babeliales bacterium]|nr:YetF domain-containing protein [Candidatus Babeliales bacterium]